MACRPSRLREDKIRYGDSMFRSPGGLRREESKRVEAAHAYSYDHLGPILYPARFIPYNSIAMKTLDAHLIYDATSGNAVCSLL